MVHFSCPCLNVRIHGRGETPPLQNVENIHLSDETAADSFFSPDTLVVTMDLCGVTKSQNLLCKERSVDGWTVTTCTCCLFDVCATHADELHRVLVNCNSQKDDHINAVIQTNRYSRLFKLVLPEINDNFIQNNIGIELHNSNLDSSVEHVQKLVSNYLKNEQRDMEDRIRKFTEVQQTNYADLLQRIRKQKQSMIYLLLKSKENEAPDENEVVSKSPEASPAVTKEIKNASSTSTDSAFDKSEASVQSHQSIPSHHDRAARRPNLRSLRRTVSNPARSAKKEKRGPRRPPVNIDVGGVFDMEEFDSREEYSEEDSEGSEGSNMEDSNHDQSASQMICATSLPMSIPAFSHYTHYSVMEDDEDDYKASLPKDPEQIAASMRALACSVTDGTEMFGELPRRRLNTGELLSSRPM